MNIINEKGRVKRYYPRLGTSNAKINSLLALGSDRWIGRDFGLASVRNGNVIKQYGLGSVKQINRAGDEKILVAGSRGVFKLDLNKIK